MPERTTFGDFVLHERLAVGGMGELYLATRTDRRTQPVALKILLREYRDSPDWVSMFRDEARIGMRLSHRDIVGVHEVGAVGDIPYIVLEYVHGENLRAVLRTMLMTGEKIPPALAVNIAIDVLLGLEHAHRAKDESGRPLQLVHRDLSPDNILLSYQGEVKILDFGIAKAAGRATETQVGVVKGKPQYMSPEQANERPVDARSDLYALALVLLELLTGEKRFHHDDHIMQFVEAKTWRAYAPSEKVKGLPVELDAVLLKGLQTEPDRRFQTADEFASALTRLVRSGQLARPPQTLAAFLARLFPGQAERRFDADEITVLRDPEPEPDLSAPPRWATDETNAAVNLATFHGAPADAPADEPTNTATMERDVAQPPLAGPGAEPRPARSASSGRRPGPAPAAGPIGAVTTFATPGTAGAKGEPDPITRESPKPRPDARPDAKARPEPKAPKPKSSSRASADSGGPRSIRMRPRDSKSVTAAPEVEPRRRGMLRALLVIVPIAIAGSGVALFFGLRKSGDEGGDVTDGTPTVTPAGARATPTRTPVRRRRTTRKPAGKATPRK